jgi:hypothetical protein
MRQRLWVSACLLLLASLAGCESRSGTNDSIIVTASIPVVAAVVGGSQTLQVSFNSSDGLPLSQLFVAGASTTLPAGWSGPLYFQCQTVTTGNGCVLNLTYTPLSTGSGTLVLNYTYVNDTGVPLSGSLTVPFAATADNHILATASPSGQVVGISNSSQPVLVTFTTDDGTPATGLTVTSGLTPLPAGWTSTATSFACARVTTGIGCQLALTYAPTAVGSGTLTLNYGYTDGAGHAQTGSLAIPYAATVHDNIIGTANPASLTVFTGSTTAVSVTFDTDDGNAASSLALTTDLGTLPAGWSSTSSQFSCASVSTGSACQLNLSYAPTAADSGTLVVNFSYVDNTGAAKTGSVSVVYVATVPHFYYANSITSSVEVCNLASNGSPTGCQDSGGTGFDYPLGITFQGSYLYVANFNSNTVSVCAASPGGPLSSCVVMASASFAGPMAVTFNAAGTLAYVSNNGGSGVSVCPVNIDGTFATCAITASGIANPAGITFLPGGQLAYLAATAAPTTGLSLCTVATDGTFSNCTFTGINTNYAFTSAISGSNLYLAVENGLTGDGAMVCPIAAAAAGAISTCQLTALGAPSDFILFSGNMVYLATNAAPSGLFLCTLNNDGTIGACAAQTDPSISSPWGMAIH